MAESLLAYLKINKKERVHHKGPSLLWSKFTKISEAKLTNLVNDQWLLNKTYTLKKMTTRIVRKDRIRASVESNRTIVSSQFWPLV